MSTDLLHALRLRLRRLGLYGLAEQLPDPAAQPWIATLLDIEERDRAKRSLQRRLQKAHIGAFKPMADFDWSWPKRLDRELVDELFTLEFIRKGENAMLVGPNGTGKTLIAQNLAHQAVLAGFTVRFTTAAALLADLAVPDSASALQRRLQTYLSPRLLAIDEVGYLSCHQRHADLLFEVVSRRYTAQASILLTTNKPFSRWGEVFPDAACVVTLVDRLVHRADILTLDGDSWRFKEARERSDRRAQRGRRKASAAGAADEPLTLPTSEACP